MVEAGGWFDGVNSITSLVVAVISVIVAALAASFSYRAIRVAHGDAVSNRLFSSISGLLTALVRVDFAVWELTRLGQGEPEARAQVMPEFVKFREAVAQVNLARAQRKRRGTAGDPLGDWILDVANNLTVALLQAEESAGIWRAYAGRDPERFAGRPEFVSDERDWDLLVRSPSFWTAYNVARDLDPHPQGYPRFGPLDEWWASSLVHSAKVTAGLPSVYDPDTNWLMQHARLLADFGESYIAPWAKDLVATGGTLGRYRTAGRR